MHLRSFPGIEASVWSGGNRLTEYDDDDDAQGVENEGPHAQITARTYIEAIEGATWEVQIEALDTYVFKHGILGATVFVDGKQVRKPMIKPGQLKIIIDGVYDSVDAYEVTLRKFLFNRIETTEDQDNNPDKVDKIGEIEIQIFRYADDGHLVDHHYVAVKGATKKLSEKKLKGRSVTHGTSYASPQPSRRPQYFLKKYLDGKDKPIAVFKFLYRSKAALQSLMIIPRTPSPPPSSRPNKKPKVSSMPKEFQVKNENRIKREHGDDSQPGPSKRRKRPSMIDLTGDEENEAPAVPFKKYETEDGVEGIDLT